MTTSRDEVLANFQAFTGIEDIGTCIGILETHKWDLLTAVNSVIPQDFSSATPQMVTPIEETDRGRNECSTLIDLTSAANSNNDCIDLTKDNVVHAPNNHRLRPWSEPRPSLEETRPPPNRMVVTEESHEDTEDESEYDDAREALSDEETITDDMFVNDEEQNILSKDPLIPVDCENPYEALNHLTEKFELRYGPVHPLFFVGSLADAVKEANGLSVAERRPIFIYLHHDKSILSNIFCSQLLCCDSIVDYLSLHYLVWAWDLTHDNLKRSLLDMVRECFGALAANNVDDLKPDHLPVILIVFKSKAQMSVRNVIQGHTDPDSLLSSLIFAHDQHQDVVEADLKEERERLAREEMKALQEQAFKESLLADQEKERQKLEEELLKQQKEEEIILENKRKEEVRQKMEDSIPSEPEEDAQKVTTLRLRYPDGSSDRRRFLASHTVGMLLNYIGSKGYHPEDYKLLTSFPRKDVTVYDIHLSLEAVQLFPQETLFIEER